MPHCVMTLSEATQFGLKTPLCLILSSIPCIIPSSSASRSPYGALFGLVLAYTLAELGDIHQAVKTFKAVERLEIGLVLELRRLGFM